MCRKKSTAMQSIATICSVQNFDADELQAKAKLLLGSYRHVCWSAFGVCQHDANDSFCVCDIEIQKAINYLYSFPPAEEKDVFERNLQALFDPRWLVELVDSAMLQVKEFPKTGDKYFTILSKFYLSKFKFAEPDLLEILQMERSKYYDLKKEAVLVFGLALWGTVLPKIQSIIDKAPLDA